MAARKPRGRKPLSTPTGETVRSIANTGQMSNSTSRTGATGAVVNSISYGSTGRTVADMTGAAENWATRFPEWQEKAAQLVGKVREMHLTERADAQRIRQQAMSRVEAEVAAARKRAADARAQAEAVRRAARGY